MEIRLRVNGIDWTTEVVIDTNEEECYITLPFAKEDDRRNFGATLELVEGEYRYTRGNK